MRFGFLCAAAALLVAVPAVAEPDIRFEVQNATKRRIRQVELGYEGRWGVAFVDLDPGEVELFEGETNRVFAPPYCERPDRENIEYRVTYADGFVEEGEIDPCEDDDDKVFRLRLRRR